jgi:PAS domain S-box-containing protein
VQNSLDAVFICDYEGRFVFINRAGENLLGYTVQEAQDLSFKEITALKSNSKVHKIMETSSAGLNVRQEKIEIKRKDGTPAFLEVNCRPIVYKNDLNAVQFTAREMEFALESESMTRKLVAAF